MGCWVRQRLGPKDEYASRASLFGTESAVAYVADAGYQGSRRRILVIDDEPLNRAMLRELLSGVGFDAAEADSAEQALTLIQDGFHAVISDIRMPGDDGHTFCRNLRSREQTKDLVHQVSDWCSGVAIKMGRRQGGPSRTGGRRSISGSIRD